MFNFKSGETVYLKTGSPALSVKDSANIDNDPNECIVLCSWFVGNIAYEKEFRAEQLTYENPNLIPPNAAIISG
jgi:uncharacterized protein YodC (DUF2158 family)